MPSGGRRGTLAQQIRGRFTDYGKWHLSSISVLEHTTARPDHCDGTYDSSCDSSRSGVCSRSDTLSKGRHGHSKCNPAYTNIRKILENFGHHELLKYMNRYWKGIRGDEEIWKHEWSKHGICVSTLARKCYGEDYVETEEVVDYLAKAVEIFQRLPTYYVRMSFSAPED